jgi:hypothetical protein
MTAQAKATGQAMATKRMNQKIAIHESKKKKRVDGEIER